jgi:hypothetical protein
MLNPQKKSRASAPTCLLSHPRIGLKLSGSLNGLILDLHGWSAGHGEGAETKADRPGGHLRMLEAIARQFREAM